MGVDVKTFLLTYDRLAGRLLQCVEVPDIVAARRRRLDDELQASLTGQTRESVLLQAPSLEDIKRTHGRYFRTFDEQMQTLDRVHSA